MLKAFQRPSAILWMTAILAITALVYAPGLSGPFLFDDPPNIIIPISAWLDGQTGWQEVLLGNNSGPLGRPIAMLTFLANAAVSGLSVVPFKATNLGIHLGCGVLLYALLQKLLPRDTRLAPHATTFALIVSTLWLIHPLQVSTVLYVVQRMAQLSALFGLAALTAYVYGRTALEKGDRSRGIMLLWVAVPAATVAAALSKENGALIPLLCAVVEIGYFRPPIGTHRPLQVKAWLVLFLILPGVAVATWLLINWNGIVASYDGRLFSLGERAMTQPRALMDYISTLLLPRGPSMGLYTDDFQPSRGLLQPPSTLLAILAIGALIILSWKSRHRIPAFATGIGLYLSAHLMESTIFPLQLHFEHRNYLPAVGFLLALVGVVEWGVAKLLQRAANPPALRRVLIGAAVAAIAVLAFGTLARVNVWSSWDTIASQGAHNHPQSMRAQLDYAQVLQLSGQDREAREVFEHMLTMQSPQARNVGAIDLITLDCMVGERVDKDEISRVEQIQGNKIELGEMLALENLANQIGRRPCDGLPPRRLADLIVGIVDRAPQSSALKPLWRSRFNAAQLYVASGDLHKAAEQAGLAWMTGAADPAVGVYLSTIYLASGDIRRAQLVVDQVRPKVKDWDHRNKRLLDEVVAELGRRASK